MCKSKARKSLAGSHQLFFIERKGGKGSGLPCLPFEAKDSKGAVPEAKRQRPKASHTFFSGKAGGRTDLEIVIPEGLVGGSPFAEPVISTSSRHSAPVP
jgi:hypothetical protein